MALVNPTIAAQPRRFMRLPVKPGTIFASLVLLVMALVVLYPIVLLIYSSFVVPQEDGTSRLGFDLWRTAFGQAGIADSVYNTFWRVIVTEIIACPAAILLVWLVTRTDLPGKKLIDTFCWAAFFLPALPVLMGWILLFDPQFGLANQAAKWLFGLSEPPFDIYTFSGIVFAHLASRSIAAKYIFLVPAFKNLDSAMEEASRIAGGSPLTTLRRIVLPVLMPAFLITLSISLIHAFESFEVELILGPPTAFYVFSTKVFQLINEDPPMFGAATVLGLAILVAMLPLIFWQQYLAHTRSFVTVTSRFSSNVLRLGAWRTPIFALICLFGIMITVVPVIFLVMGTFMSLYGYFDIGTPWTFDHWRRVLNDAQLIHSIGNTLIMGGSAAIIGVLWYAVVAYISVRTRYRARGFLDFLSWLPASVPGIILGLALLWMFLSVPLFRPIYGTVGVLVLACILASISTGVQLIKSNMIQLGNELEEASLIAGGSWLYTFRRIILPLLGPVLLSVGMLTFVSAARNVSNVAMLITSDNRPLAMLQVDYMIDGRFESAAVAGVIIVVMTFCVSILARWIAHRLGFGGWAR